MTATRAPAAKLSDIPKGAMRVVEVEGLRVALCNVDGKIYAIEDVCTHDDGPIGAGRLDGFEAECPRHGARFDVRTGAVTRMPAVVPVRSFPVRIEAEQIFVDVQ